MSDTMDPIEGLIASLLKELGEDPGRDGLERTPRRVARAFRTFTEGYSTDPIAVLNDAVFEETYDEMVLVKDIGFYSLCEHHLLPFFGRAHVAYIPNGRIVGLSKLPRMVEMYARRLQVQERLTQDVAGAIELSGEGCVAGDRTNVAGFAEGSAIIRGCIHGRRGIPPRRVTR